MPLSYAVKDEFIKLLNEIGLKQDFNDIDDVVIDYIVSTLEELHSECFSVDDFILMLDAYFPGFSRVEVIVIQNWLNQLERLLKLPVEKENDPPDRTFDLLIKPPSPPSASAASGEQSGGASASASATVPLESSYFSDKDSKKVLDMFPLMSLSEVHTVLSMTDGDTDKAISLLLLQEETGECIIPAKSYQPSARKTDLSDRESKKLKEKTLKKYAFVPVEEGVERVFKPNDPRWEGKKMVRYIDNKVVTTKGQRFIDMKQEESEEMKKTYVNLKPARQYKFH